MSDNFDIDSIKGINIDKVIADPRFSAIVKVTAEKLKKNPYMTLSDFFRHMNKADITVLNIIGEMASDGDSQCLQDIIVLVEMLTRAEGTEVVEVSAATDNVNYFLTLITVVSLWHKGLVDIIWENMSFGPEYANKDVAVIKG